MRLRDLYAPVEEEFDVEEALAEWQWLVRGPVTTLAVTAFGDLFLAKTSGPVLFLDTIAGKCDEVAVSADAWRQQIQNPERLDEWLMPALFIALHEAGIYLSRGECYSAVHAVVLGGSFTVDNWTPTPWQVHFASSGRLHEQVRNVPPGTMITGITYDPL